MLPAFSSRQFCFSLFYPPKHQPIGQSWDCFFAQQANPLQPPGSCHPCPALRSSRPGTRLILPSSLWHFLQQLLERKHSQVRDAANPPPQDLKLATGPGPLTHHALTDMQARPCSAGSPLPGKELSKQRGLRPRRGGVHPKPSDRTATSKHLAGRLPGGGGLNQ